LGREREAAGMRVVGRRRGEWGSGAERPGEAGEEEGFLEPPHRWGLAGLRTPPAARGRRTRVLANF
jgi:hypothetical protein